MTQDRYSLLELRALKHRELTAIGERLGLKLTKNDNKLVCIQKIMAEYARGDVRQSVAGDSSDRLPENPEFERLIDAENPVDEPANSQHASNSGARGGTRAGAGRPLGMTDSKARMNNLPQQPNPAIQFALVGLFDAWAAAAKVKEIALTSDEAMRLALPYSQLAAYFGWDRYLPDWAQLALVATWNTYDIAKVKLAIIREAKRGTHGPSVGVGAMSGVSDDNMVRPEADSGRSVSDSQVATHSR